MIAILKSRSRHSKTEGQVLLITVLLLGGSTIAASTIAGFLLLRSIRQSSDIANSTKAVFAADTGIEWDLYRRFKDNSYPKPQLTNDASFDVVSTATSTRSVGESGKSYRAFQLTF